MRRKTESEQRTNRERFDDFLEIMFHDPDRRSEISDQMEAEYGRQAAVMVLDTSGFTRTTQRYGIFAFLMMVHQVKRVARPIVEANQGYIVKAEADNLYCLFDTVAAAIEASKQILAMLDKGNDTQPPDQAIYASIGIAFGGVLDLAGEDFYGDAVNLACKLGEDLADRGQILITADAFLRLGEGPAAAIETASISGLLLDYVMIDRE